MNRTTRRRGRTVRCRPRRRPRPGRGGGWRRGRSTPPPTCSAGRVAADRGCVGRARRRRCIPHDAGVSPPAECVATTSGVWYRPPGGSTTSPGWSSSPSWMKRRPSASRSASRVWLPLHARCASHTSPFHSPKPRVPAARTGGDCREVRPRRFSTRWPPTGHSPRASWNSRVHRPDIVSSSSACSGTGNVMVSASRNRSSPPRFSERGPHDERRRRARS